MKQFVEKDLTNIHPHFKSLPEYLLGKDSSFNQKIYERMIIFLLINWIIATVLAGMSLKGMGTECQYAAWDHHLYTTCGSQLQHQI